MLIIRQLLVKENSYSSQYRAMLLLMIELVNNKYEIKDVQLKEFYLSNIKAFSFEYPFSQKELRIVAQAKTENGNGILVNVKLMFLLTSLNVKRNECK